MPAVPAPGPASPPPSPAAAPRLFASDSFWNARVANDAPLDPLSATYVAGIQQQLTTWKPWINTTEYSTPLYTVGADQPSVRVQLDKPPGVNADLQAAWEQVPLPAGARPAGGTDAQLVVWQPATDTMWEFWQLSRSTDGWHAKWGGRMGHVSTNPGYYDDPPNWGATATSLPKIGGTMTIEELRRGHIDHALAMGLPQTRANVFSWPAQRTDGLVDSPDAIPEGTRFRLDPALDVSALNLPPIVRMMAEAAQRYGIVVRDKSGSISFYAEDPTPTGSDPYTGQNGLFPQGVYPSIFLRQFPWSHLQALRTQLRTS